MGMSQQGEKPTDDWWQRLYDESVPDTGPANAGDTLDDRFDSASDALSSPAAETDAASPGLDVTTDAPGRERAANSAGEPFGPPADAVASVPPPRRC